jgi:ferredoxin
MARPLSDLKLERGKYPPSIENDMQAGSGEAAADD